MLQSNDAVFTALDPFFAIVQRGLAGLVGDGHYFDTIADDAVFEFRYVFPGWPQRLVGRNALMGALCRLRQQHRPARRGRARRAPIAGPSCRDSRIRSPWQDRRDRPVL